MPKIYGQLTDFGLGPLTELEPVLLFEHNAPGVAGNAVLSTRPVRVPVGPSGFFEAELIAAARISPAGFYRISIEYRDKPTQQRRIERLPWQLFVPAEGGILADILRVPANPALVWTGTEPPANPSPGTWWLDPEGMIHERGLTGWTFKQNIRGPAGYNAAGTEASQKSVADWIKETAGPNPVSAALAADYVSAVIDAAGDVTLYQNGIEL